MSYKKPEETKAEPIAASVSYSGEQVKIKFYIEGKEFAFRLTKDGLNDLLHNKGEKIARIEFDLN